MLLQTHVAWRSQTHDAKLGSDEVLAIAVV